MAARRKHASRPKRSKVYRRGRVPRRRLQSGSRLVVPQALHARFSGVASKRRRTGPFSVTGSRSAYGGAGSAPATRRKRSAPVNAMQELTKSKRRLTLGKYKMSRVVSSLVNHRIERFENISNFDTNVGSFYIDNQQTTAGAVNLPMYIIDLGSLTQPVMATASPALYRAGWTSLTKTADLQLTSCAGTTADGTSTSANWQVELSDKATASSFDSAIINWVQLKLNLYGQRKRTTKFQITAFQVTQEEVDPVSGLVSNLDRKALFQYLERPYIFSNLQQDLGRKKTGIKILKEWTYNVAAMTSIDLNTTTGNIHEACIDFKINKKMNYNQNSAANILDHAQGDGIDFTVSDATAVGGLTQQPRPKQNVYVAIRAFAPVRCVGDATSNSGDSPSMDIIIRRSLSLPPHN
ncbi:MAG: putative capsid protein [Cressdnaviricota sp.]|nr:MAG: putative capsid protein [Cressdnaviricota sp.]